jgi:hypothetical protein
MTTCGGSEERDSLKFSLAALRAFIYPQLEQFCKCARGAPVAEPVARLAVVDNAPNASHTTQLGQAF